MCNFLSTLYLEKLTSLEVDSIVSSQTVPTELSAEHLKGRKEQKKFSVASL